MHLTFVPLHLRKKVRYTGATSAKSYSRALDNVELTELSHSKVFLSYAGRARITWRARATFKTRLPFVPQMIRTKRHGSACLRWRRTSGAAQRLRSNQGQVRFYNGWRMASFLSILSINKPGTI